MLGSSTLQAQNTVDPARIRVVMREASGAPSPKNSRNASRKGCSRRLSGSRLRPAPARKSGRAAAIVGLAAPSEWPIALPHRPFSWRPRRARRTDPAKGPQHPDRCAAQFPTGLRRYRHGRDRSRKPRRYASNDSGRAASGRRYPSFASAFRAGETSMQPAWLVCFARRHCQERPAHPSRFTAPQCGVAFRHRSVSPALPPSIRFAAVACVAPGVGGNGGCRRYRGPAQTAADAFACCRKA
jgi:hypothetical protein